MMLVMLIALPLLAAAAIAAAPESRTKGIATLGSLLPVGWFAFLAASFNWTSGVPQMDYAVKWFEPLGLTFTIGVDSVSMLLIGLTVLLGPICVIGSYTAVSERIKTYYAWLLVLQAAMTGVFCAQDVILFYVFFEFTLVPMYILINLYGSTNRRAAATKFFLYTFTGSLVTLAGLVYVAYRHAGMVPSGEWTFDFDALSRTCRSFDAGEQAMVFWALMAGFAIKVPLFPVHTWLPLAHTEAPTAGSVVLAGVLLKLGTYGLYRFALQFCPAAAVEFAPVLAVICCIGILYAGLICWVQTDVKKLVAYSSVSHLGFCILGMFALNASGLQGSILYMINHGLSTGALFLMIGMIYERYHTRNMKELGGLAAKMPIWATFMVIFTMASVGLPGTNGFVSEFLCLFGAFQAGGDTWKGLAADGALPVGATVGRLGPYVAFVAGTGMIVTAIYLLYMLGKVVWGPLVEPGGHGHGGHGHGHDSHGESHDGPLPRDLSRREIGLLIPLAALCIGIGFYPASMLRTLEQPTRATARMIADSVAQARPAVPSPGEAKSPATQDHEVSAAARPEMEAAQ